MPSTLDIPAPTHREVQPPRQCTGCGAWLRSTNETSHCSPCSTPTAELIEEDFWEMLEGATMPERKRLAAALEGLEIR